MRVLRFFGTLLSVLGAALAGNWAGEQVRALMTGEPARQYRFVQVDEHGEATIAVNLTLTHFLPALFVALLVKPRWLGAFVGGLVASGLLDERYEERLSEWLGI